MKERILPLLLFFILFALNFVCSQQDTNAVVLDYEEHVVKTGGDDSLQLKLIKEHNPTKAGLWAIVPGGGQIYNKKWWKLPIVYSLLGASGYLVYYFADKTVMYRNEYFFRQYGATEYYNPDLALAQDESILQSRDNNRRYMEISIGAFTICYLLSVIDAVVDAHLFYFDISDDLTMQLTPTIYNNGLLFNNNNAFRSFSSGLTLKLSF